MSFSRPTSPPVPPPPSVKIDCAQMAALEEQALRRVGDAGDDAGHDDEADAVADAVLVDLLAEPHQEDGAGGHGDDRR